MADPVLAKLTGSYHCQTPSARLRRSFASIWIHRMDAVSAPPIVITPDATIDLQWIGGTFRFAGPDREPQTEILSAGEVVIGFRFHPAAAAAWLGMPLVELVGQRLPLEDLWGKRARRLASRVRVQDDVEGLLFALEAAVAEENVANETNALMSTAYNLIERGAPSDAALIPWLMRALGMSERTLRRRFRENFGYGPKTLARILRYQRFLRLSSQSNSPTSILASEAGYSDQAHLVHESRRLTGSTPGQINRFALSGLMSATPDELHSSAFSAL
jgi:AraC-like DNA-binding protein